MLRQDQTNAAHVPPSAFASQVQVMVATPTVSSATRPRLGHGPGQALPAQGAWRHPSMSTSHSSLVSIAPPAHASLVVPASVLWLPVDVAVVLSVAVVVDPPSASLVDDREGELVLVMAPVDVGAGDVEVLGPPASPSKKPVSWLQPLPGFMQSYSVYEPSPQRKYVGVDGQSELETTK